MGRCNMCIHLVCSHERYGSDQKADIESDISAYISMALSWDNSIIVDRSSNAMHAMRYAMARLKSIRCNHGLDTATDHSRMVIIRSAGAFSCIMLVSLPIFIYDVSTARCRSVPYASEEVRCIHDACNCDMLFGYMDINSSVFNVSHGCTVDSLHLVGVEAMRYGTYPIKSIGVSTKWNTGNTSVQWMIARPRDQSMIQFTSHGSSRHLDHRDDSEMISRVIDSYIASVLLQLCTDASRIVLVILSHPFKMYEEVSRAGRCIFVSLREWDCDASEERYGIPEWSMQLHEVDTMTEARDAISLHRSVHVRDVPRSIQQLVSELTPPVCLVNPYGMHISSDRIPYDIEYMGVCCQADASDVAYNYTRGLQPYNSIRLNCTRLNDMCEFVRVPCSQSVLIYSHALSEYVSDVVSDP